MAFYPQNDILINVNGFEDYGYRVNSWVWSNNIKGANAIFLKVGRDLINLKDIARIVKTASSGSLTVNFKDGRSTWVYLDGLAFFNCRDLYSCQGSAVAKNNDALPLFFLNDSVLNSKIKVEYELQTSTSLAMLIHRLKEGVLEVGDQEDYDMFLKRVEEKRLLDSKVENGKFNSSGGRYSEQAIQEEAIKLRAKIKVGNITNCGSVYEIRGSMIGVQTKFGKQFIERESLFGPLAACVFDGKRYIGR